MIAAVRHMVPMLKLLPAQSMLLIFECDVFREACHEK